MNNDILIFGKGFIGQKLQEALNCRVADRRINNFGDASTQIKEHAPKIIINCIGYTGENNVDDCEQNQDKTFFSNTFVPIMLGELCFRNNIKLIHIGSGCTYHFDYEKQEPITEEDIPDFFNLFYSRSKIYTDNALLSLMKRARILILKIRIPLDCKPHPKNIFTKLLSFKNIIDIPNSVTYIPDFIKAVKHLMKIDAKGVYNVVNEGGLRYTELLEVYKKHRPNHEYEVINYQQLNLTRTNLLMSTKKLSSTNFKVRDIHEVLEECVEKYVSGKE